MTSQRSPRGFVTDRGINTVTLTQTPPNLSSDHQHLFDIQNHDLVYTTEDLVENFNDMLLQMRELHHLTTDLVDDLRDLRDLDDEDEDGEDDTSLEASISDSLTHSTTYDALLEPSGDVVQYFNSILNQVRNLHLLSKELVDQLRAPWRSAPHSVHAFIWPCNATAANIGSVVVDVNGTGVTVVDEDHISCVICLEGYETGEVMALLPCGHRLHERCITREFEERFSCPFCRAGFGWVVAKISKG